MPPTRQWRPHRGGDRVVLPLLGALGDQPGAVILESWKSTGHAVLPDVDAVDPRSRHMSPAPVPLRKVMSGAPSRPGCRAYHIARRTCDPQPTCWIGGHPGRGRSPQVPVSPARRPSVATNLLQGVVRVVHGVTRRVDRPGIACLGADGGDDLLARKERRGGEQRVAPLDESRVSSGVKVGVVTVASPRQRDRQRAVAIAHVRGAGSPAVKPCTEPGREKWNFAPSFGAIGILARERRGRR